MIGYIDRDFCIRWTNLRFAEWYHVAPETWWAARWLIFMVRRHLQRSRRASNAPFVASMCVTASSERPDDSSLWISVSLYPHRDAVGDVVGDFRLFI